MTAAFRAKIHDLQRHEAPHDDPNAAATAETLRSALDALQIAQLHLAEPPDPAARMIERAAQRMAEALDRATATPSPSLRLIWSWPTMAFRPPCRSTCCASPQLQPLR